MKKSKKNSKLMKKDDHKDDEKKYDKGGAPNSDEKNMAPAPGAMKKTS